jgi:regulator of protease activity HflC (stomatin/prohibitin superfamily)
MSKLIAIVIGIILLVSLVLFSMTFTVNYHEIAIKTRFGRTGSESVIDQPGLKFRLPLSIDSVTKIDKRLQLRESPLETIQTSDGQQVVVRAFMMWKVRAKESGPLEFYQTFPGGVTEANESIVDQFRTAMRVGLSRYAFDDLIGPHSRLQAAEQAIMDEMVVVKKKGIEPVSVGISQLMLPPNTSLAVMERMSATRTKMSEIERDKGQADATAIESQAKAKSDPSAARTPSDTWRK